MLRTSTTTQFVNKFNEGGDADYRFWRGNQHFISRQGKWATNSWNNENEVRSTTSTTGLHAASTSSTTWLYAASTFAASYADRYSWRD
jgi:hypothetical protein